MLIDIGAHNYSSLLVESQRQLEGHKVTLEQSRGNFNRSLAIKLKE